MADEDCYKMTSRPRGMCVIIDNYIDEEDEEDVSPSTNNQLVETFEKLHFNVTFHELLKRAEFLQVMEDLSQVDHSGYDCVVVFISAHGDKDVVYSADKHDVPIEELRSYLKPENCISLVRKPKMFFIDACRGGKDQIPVKIMPKNEDEVDAAEPYYVSNDADFFLGFATTESHHAYDGYRCYKEVVVDTLHKKADSDHLLDMMTEVNRKMARDLFYTPDCSQTVQTPEIRSTLTKKVFFK